MHEIASLFGFLRKGTVAMLFPICLSGSASITGLLAAQPVPSQNRPMAQVLRRENARKLRLTNTCIACDLEGVDLSAAHLIGADLRRANLSHAILTYANLEGTDFTGADLSGADLTGAFLTNAVMKEAQLDRVNFTGARLYNVNIVGASVQSVDLTDAQIWRTPLSVGGVRPLEAETLPDLPAPSQ